MKRHSTSTRRSLTEVDPKRQADAVCGTRGVGHSVCVARVISRDEEESGARLLHFDSEGRQGLSGGLGWSWLGLANPATPRGAFYRERKR